MIVESSAKLKKQQQKYFLHLVKLKKPPKQFKSWLNWAGNNHLLVTLSRAIPTPRNWYTCPRPSAPELSSKYLELFRIINKSTLNKCLPPK